MPKFIPVLTEAGWKVDLPANMSACGKRERRFFREEKEAKRFSSSLRAKWGEGRRGGIIPADLAMEAGRAAKILEGTGITLLEAAKAAAERAAASGDSETFRDKYNKAILDGEGRWSAIYLKDMGRLPRWVGEEFMSMPVAGMTESVIDRTLVAHGASAQSTLDHRRRYVRAILGNKPRHRRERKVAIMSLADCERALAVCADTDERMAIAVLLWAGIRPDPEHGEISRLDWSTFTDGKIYVGEAEAKTNTDRFIPITPRLAREIAGHPDSGPVAPANWKRKWARIRKDAGISGQDVTRHTFASHFLAAFGEDATKDAMGHSANSRTLFRHYRSAVTREDGLAFFA